jgi:hypothetical protein
MSTNRLPPEYRDDSDRRYFEHVLHFTDRLIHLQESLQALANSVDQIEPDMTETERDRMSESYKELASFTGLLAFAARRLDAEVSETGAAFQNRGAYSALTPTLRRQLEQGMDQQLLEEIGPDYHDGDKANFPNQISAFVSELRDHYQIHDRQR